MTIGSRIRRLRMEKDMTQKALAGYLGVGIRDVDFWEKDGEEPPLEIIRRLAVRFETTTDELLCMDSFEDDKYIKSVTAEFRRLISENRVSDAANAMRSALKAHPNNWNFRCMLMYALYLACDQPSMVRFYGSEIRQLHDSIIAACPDDSLRTTARRLYALHLASDLGDTVGAEQEAMRLPDRSESRQNLLPMVCPPEKKADYLRRNIVSTAVEAVRDLNDLFETTKGDLPSSAAAAEAAAEALPALLGGECGPLWSQVCRARLRLAEIYGSRSQLDSAIEAFSAAAEAAMAFDALDENHIFETPTAKGVMMKKSDYESAPLTVWIRDKVLKTPWASSLAYDPRMTDICTRLGRAASSAETAATTGPEPEEPFVSLTADETAEVVPTDLSRPSDKAESLS
ncbi:MAG: helix-turn-helix transcriptional regulator [Clostridiales bacterium]|nr:helix-turn-helix transcriptional regulator [Clostridiales bacterium]